MEAATRALGADLSHVLVTHHLPPTKENEMRYPYYPCYVTAKPACNLQPSAMGATPSGATIGSRTRRTTTSTQQYDAPTADECEAVLGYLPGGKLRRASTSRSGGTPWWPAWMSDTWLDLSRSSVY